MVSVKRKSMDQKRGRVIFQCPVSKPKLGGVALFPIEQNKLSAQT